MLSETLATRSFDVSRTINAEAKRAIARAAVELCEDGDAVIINGGTTTFQMAQFLRNRKLKVLTNSYPLAEFLIRETENRVALPGGEVYRAQKLIVAAFDDDAIQHYSARLMFMSAMSIGPRGVIEGDPLIARAETKLLQRADKLVVLADASKFAVKGSLVVCPLKRIHMLITDAGAPSDALAMLREESVETLVVDAKASAAGAAMIAVEGAPAPLLEVRGIDKSFPGVHALSDVSFDVRAGEVHALVGENGAGKSTLIKIMSGVYRPDSGSILVEGRETRLADARRRAPRRRCDDLSGTAAVPRAVGRREHLPRPRAARARRVWIDWREMRAKAEALLASLEIDDLAVDQIVGALTVGMRQRVEILRALSHDARILIMDEPTAALTESDVARLFDIVRRLKARGVGIIYISHRLEEIFRIADRVTVLRDGAYVGRRQVAETNSAELVQMMVGRRIDNLFPKVVAPIGAPVLEARDIVRPPMVKSVSLTVRAGEIVGLAGLVGSGRSEFAQAVFGVTPAESGEIRLMGKAVRIVSPESGRAKGIAYVPEDRGVQGLVRPMSVLHNLSLAGLGALSRAGFIDRARRAASGGDGDPTFQRQDEFARRDRGSPFGRQPAEDRARQMARQQSQAADPR